MQFDNQVAANEAGLPVGTPPAPPPLPPFLSCPGKRFQTARSSFKPVKVHFAVNSDNVTRIRQLASEGTSLDYVMHGHSPLTLAIVKENFNVALALIEGGADHSIAEVTSPCRLPIHSAVKFNALPVLKALVAHRANIHSVDKMGFTPLHYACINNCQVELVEFLLDQGAHINVRDDRGRTPFFRAAQSESENLLRYLHSQGASVNISDHFGWTPLHEATVCGNENLVELLLTLGCDTRGSVLLGDSLMHAAVTALSRSQVAVLANTSPDFFGRRASAVSASWSRALAMSGEKASLVYTLLDWGVDFERKDLNGRTPLRVAAVQEHWNVVRLLLWAGASVPQEDEQLTSWMQENSISDESRTLKFHCKRVIRQSLSPHIDRKVGDLPMPVQLQMFISLLQCQI
ncbi:hypothetical protein CAPTEDRAFT_182489 [Capitella teleta]|uniref:Uncharacterized protein n=1 Tax=Capitella teleta TaxID=283909 RepID=R7TG64_CAPTE|nr:hypothetical protein CAPTEDRAFT_182489 [Capitella teleta]|eukprot:ELT92773.1 hypothetical protein CAPTEDRAFT_182489 [Capitella teleta]